jgi:hypothetical protein
LYGTESCTVQKLDLKYLESFEMCCWTRMEMISWTYYVKNAEVLDRFKEERNIVHTIIMIDKMSQTQLVHVLFYLQGVA